ncbi:sensor histidine kinase [Actinoplanes sp. KI2]|uniref:sensor histidine kinase n=1 Tax=Actinoplanes sp. KI2 TaxID=2983315 RepID=UPI0021D58CAE|nr:sensor histidine kinase [Actinoplanes sp. KI2]MCU7726146.1 sensor histidine kinase [Actinoplanes sp. KI2]
MVRLRRQTLDVAAAVVVAAVCGVAAQEAGRSFWWLAAAGVAAPVAVRSRLPLVAATAALAAATAVLAGGVVPPFAAPILCAVVALTVYPVASALPLSRSGPLLGLGLVAAAALFPRWPAAPLVAMPAVAVPWLMGRLVRQRRQFAERIADERTARAVAQERLRIARDIHDTVAHSLSMIVMKAGVARHVSAVRPEESATALAVIETAGRDALVEMRRALGLLRADDDPATPTGSEGDLRALAEHAEQVGVRVELALVDHAALPDGVRLAVYRIVQEALTNVIRHARAGRCTVTIEAGPEAVTVEIRDDGTAATAGPGETGYGLRGMRERVIAYGGSLRAGPATAGGFAVDARVPYRPPGAET